MVKAEGYQVIGLVMRVGNYVDWQTAVEKNSDSSRGYCTDYAASLLVS